MHAHIVVIKVLTYFMYAMVGPLEDNAGNIITQGYLRAEELNVHFSSVFTREYTSSLPVPETKFNGSEGEKVGAVSCNPRSSS